MDRRVFTKSLGAILATPALPQSAVAQHSVSGARALSPVLIERAQHWASLWVDVSVGMFERCFDLDPPTAERLFASLLKENVISAPNKYGVARATIPYFNKPEVMAKITQMARPKVPSNPDISKDIDLEKAKDVARKIIDTPSDESDEGPTQ